LGGSQSGGAPQTTGGVPASGGAAPGGGGFTCPAPPFAGSPVPSGATAQQIEGVPPQDSFITDSMDLVIIEGPVWLNGALYVSEIENGPLFGGLPGGFGGRGGGPGGGGGAGGGGASSGAGGGAGGMTSAPPPARILKVTEEGQVSVVLPDSGTNGLAIDPSGALVGCNHKTGAISKFDLNGGAPVDLIAMYMGTRFDSPNDLTFGADGTLYFSDPDYQAPSPAPQSETRAYRVPRDGSTAIPIGDGPRQPNGMTLSPDRKILYISSSGGIFSFPVAADGSLGTETRFGQSALNSDGMGMDCAGNLYTASGQNVVILSPAGTEVGRIAVPGGVQSVTNIAFGGADHTTIYITAQGTGGRAGLFKITGAIPGMPY
jgi:gluconolactonase